ncbi:hypothetical protein Hamer_G027236, partial [Homarus americanus]
MVVYGCIFSCRMTLDYRVTMPPYGLEFRQFFKQSDSDLFKALSDLMDIVPSTSVGLHQATEKKYSLYAGLYEKWIADMLLKARRERHRKQREYQEKQDQEVAAKQEGY